MKIKGLTEGQLQEIIREADENIIFNREPERIGNFLHFTLRVVSSKGAFAKVSVSGRRSVALCWHGHRDVMRVIFDRYPKALLVTAMARYDGREGFESEYPATGQQNAGSAFNPMPFAYCCECGEY